MKKGVCILMTKFLFAFPALPTKMPSIEKDNFMPMVNTFAPLNSSSNNESPDIYKLSEEKEKNSDIEILSTIPTF